jgi:hypothetical protein
MLCLAEFDHLFIMVNNTRKLYHPYLFLSLYSPHSVKLKGREFLPPSEEILAPTFKQRFRKQLFYGLSFLHYQAFLLVSLHNVNTDWEAMWRIDQPYTLPDFFLIFFF